MNLLDPVRWGTQAAFAVTSTAVKIGINAVKTAELLLGRDGADDEEQRYGAVSSEATVVERDRETPGSAVRTPGRRPMSAAGAAPTIPRGARRQNDLQAPTAGHTEEEPDELVETEGSASPGATLRIDAPWDGYDRMKAAEIARRVKEGDDATKAVVRLYEQTNKKRKSVLAATE